MQMETLSFADASLTMEGAKAEFVEASLHEWKESFLAESTGEYLSDVALWQVLSNRNLKRIRFQMIPAARYVQLLFPYLDSAVMQAYFSLPIEFLRHQNAHCYAGFYRFRQFGDYQASGYPISLKREATNPAILYGLRMSASQIHRLLSKLNGAPRFTGSWNAWHVAVKDETMECPLFNKTMLDELFVSKRLRPEELYKMHTLWKFYESYVENREN
jgi:hypothetical protein